MPTILVTGANKGIGLQLCKQLKERGDDVIAVCRVPSAELTEIGVRIIEGIDVSEGDAIVRLKSKLSDQPLDVLVNNAGILKGDRFGNLDCDVMLEQFRVNSLGPLRVCGTNPPFAARRHGKAI